MSEKHFLTRREIHEWLREIISLDYAQRAAVEEEMMKFIGNGGISHDELEYKLLRELRAMRDHGKIGSEDYGALEKALRELYG
jgi:hypothetical protein